MWIGVLKNVQNKPLVRPFFWLNLYKDRFDIEISTSNKSIGFNQMQLKKNFVLILEILKKKVYELLFFWGYKVSRYF